MNEKKEKVIYYSRKRNDFPSEDEMLKRKLRGLFNLPDWAGKEEIIKAITEKLF